MEAVNWAAASSSLTAQWLPYNFARGQCSLFGITINSRVTACGAQHCV